MIESFFNSSALLRTIYIIDPSKVFCAIYILIFRTDHLLPAVFECDAQSGILPSCVSLLFFYLTVPCSFTGALEKSTGMILIITPSCAFFKGFSPLDIKFELFFWGPIAPAHAHPGICWGRDPITFPRVELLALRRFQARDSLAGRTTTAFGTVAYLLFANTDSF